MDTPVFKLWLAKPRLEAFLLPQERFNEFGQKHAQAQKDLGVRNLISGTVWSDERYTGFGVEWFPNWQAVREYHRCLDELHWFQYLQSEIFLGVEVPDLPMRLEPLNLDPNVDWLVHIFVARHSAAWYHASAEELAELDRLYEQQASSAPFIFANTRPFQELWEGWGIEFYPSLEQLVQHTDNLEKIKWWKYLEAQTFHGTAEDGELFKK